MNINDIIQLIMNNGMSVVLMAYFLMKDWKYNGQIISILTEIKEVLAIVRKDVEQK